MIVFAKIRKIVVSPSFWIKKMMKMGRRFKVFSLYLLNYITFLLWKKKNL